jgi:hypothetical protein
MKIVNYLLIAVSLTLIIAVVKMNRLGVEKTACINEYSSLYSHISKLVDAIEGKKPDIEIQLIPVPLQNN